MPTSLQHHALTCVLLASAWLAASPPSLGQQSSEAEDSPIPEAWSTLADAASERLASECDAGLRAAAGEEESANLVAIVKTLRSFGYGSQPASAAGRGGRGGGRGRAGGQRGGGAAARFASLDTDGDGVLRGSEIGQRLQGSERAADDEVTLEEFEAAWAEMFGAGRGGGRGRGGNRGQGAGQRSGTDAPDGGASPRRGRGRQGAAGVGDAQFVLLFDGDRDRRVTLEEIRLAIRQDLLTTLTPYAALDSDQDTTLTEAEARANAGVEDAPRLPFRQADADQDGSLTPEELVAYVETRSRPRLRAINACLQLRELAAEDSDRLAASRLAEHLKSLDLADLDAVQPEKEEYAKTEVYSLLLAEFRGARATRTATR